MTRDKFRKETDMILNRLRQLYEHFPGTDFCVKLLDVLSKSSKKGKFDQALAFFENKSAGKNLSEEEANQIISEASQIFNP